MSLTTVVRPSVVFLLYALITFHVVSTSTAIAGGFFMAD
jgi:hypothetical protein